MARRPRAVHEAQFISDIAERSGLTVLNVRKAFESYDKVSIDYLMAGKKIPLPAAMGYIYATVTRTESRELKSTFTDTPVTLRPKLLTVAKFSIPWKKRLNENPRAAQLIEQIILNKKINKKKIKLKKKSLPEEV